MLSNMFKHSSSTSKIQLTVYFFEKMKKVNGM